MSDITLLCVTHERPQWMPWVIKQMGKFKDAHIVVVDSSEHPNKLFDLHPSRRVTYLHAPGKPGIAAKRNIALIEVKTPYFAWFDDDDWSHPKRISSLLGHLQEAPWISVAGSTRGYKIDARALKAQMCRTIEPVLFNSAVYRTERWRETQFDESLTTGEDTDWQLRGIGYGYHLRTEEVLTSWLCHGSNITNKASSLILEDEPTLIRSHLEELKQNPEYRR